MPPWKPPPTFETPAGSSRAMSTHLVGQRIKRLEDPDLLSGRGQFVDDLKIPGLLHAAFLRSPVGHARIRGIDKADTMTMPGVHAVWTAAELPENMHDRRMLLQVPNPAIRHPFTQDSCVKGCRIAGFGTCSNILRSCMFSGSCLKTCMTVELSLIHI